jgi:hypothetical protein
MIYFQNKFIIIRELKQTDIQNFAEEFNKQGWNKSVLLFQQYFEDQEKGKVIVFVAEYENQLAGYVILKSCAEYGPFKDKKIPEIMILIF